MTTDSKTKTGINLYNLLVAMGKEEEIALIKATYENNNFTDFKNYSFSYRESPEKKEEKFNNIFPSIIKSIQENEQIRKTFNDIWDDLDNKVNVKFIRVTKENLKECKVQIRQTISNLSDQSENLDAFYDILYAVIGLKIYCGRLKDDLSLPEPTDKGRAITFQSAQSDFESLMKAPIKKLFDSTAGRRAAEFFNFKARASCQFGSGTPLPTLMQQIQLVGKMISSLNKDQCLSDRFVKEKLIGDHVPNDFRPGLVKYIVIEFVNNRTLNPFEKKDKLSMFNPTGGWGGRLIGALATPEISRYVETDPNPDLLNIKKSILEKFGSTDKKFSLYDSPIESLSKDEYCSNDPVQGFQKHDISIFSPPYFNVEKYKDQTETTCQSYKKFPKLETWLRGFLFHLIDINYQALKVFGIMVINLAPITVKQDDINEPENLNVCYPECVSKIVNSNKFFINLPEILKIELSSGIRIRQWEFVKEMRYSKKNGDESNLLMFFKTKPPVTPLYRKLINYSTDPEPQVHKRKLFTEENDTEVKPLKKTRLSPSRFFKSKSLCNLDKVLSPHFLLYQDENVTNLTNDFVTYDLT